MVKRNITILLLISLAFMSYGQNWETFAYPFLKTQIKNIQPPANIDSALNQLDIILTNEIIEHFKTENENVATVRICQELGNFFINHWKLRDRLGEANIGFRGVHNTPDIVRYFSDSGMDNPYLIMWVVFKCYHKKLNKKEFSTAHETAILTNHFGKKVSKVAKIEQYWKSIPMIEAYEDSILSVNKLEGLVKNDTLGRRYHEEKRDSEFYITGVIDSINYTNHLISLRIIDIVSNKRYRLVYFNKELLKSGDAITIGIQDWSKYNDTLFSYRYGKFETSLPQWNEYIKLKYPYNELH